MSRNEAIFENQNTGEKLAATELVLKAKQKPVTVDLYDWDKTAEVATNNEPAGKKFDKEKTDFSLVPGVQYEDLAKVFTMGCKKYGRENWKEVENGMFRYFAAAERHMNKYKKYMETGDESYLWDEDEPHLHTLAHAATNMMFLQWLDHQNSHTFAPEDEPEWHKKKNSNVNDSDYDTFGI